MSEKSTKKVSVSYASNENESASLSATKATLPTNARREKRERERERDEAIFSESSSPVESKFFEFYARKETTRNECYEIKLTLLPPDFCPPDKSLSFFSVSSGMNRFGVSVFRLLLRSVILSPFFCNEHIGGLSG